MDEEKFGTIAVFSLAYAPFEGGAEIAIREITQRLPEFFFTIFTAKFDADSPSEEHDENVKILRLGKASRRRYGMIIKKITYIFQAWQEAERQHQRRRFDLIWVVMASYGGVAALLFKLNHPTIKILLTVQEGDSEKHLRYGKFGMVGIFGRILMRSADSIQVISGYLKDFCLRQGATAPIEVVPNGVDEKLFATRYRDAEIRSLRGYLGIKDEYVAITTSRLVHKNGVDILIRAIGKFKEKRQNIKCLIIGDGPERKKLESLSEKLSLENNVIFLGQIRQNDLPLYFAVADMFIRPSRSEGLGNSFLEAMSAGIPVIGTPVGGIVDFLKDGETGFVADAENPDSVAFKMQEILSDETATKKIVIRAEELVHRSYSWDIVAKFMRNIFDRLINL